MPVRSTNTAIYVVRVPVLVLTLLILSTVVLTLQSAREQRAGLEIYEQYGDTSELALSSNYGWTDPETVDEDLGPWLRQVDTDGDMVLAARTDPSEFLPEEHPEPRPPEPQPPVLVANDTYLTEEEGVSSDGERYGAEETIRVIAPESSTEYAEQMAAGVREWVGMKSDQGQTPEAEVLPSADGQTLFTYGTQGDHQGSSLPLLQDPILVVLPNGQTLSDSNYVDYMSQRAAVFPDPDVADQAREEQPQVSRYISMVEALSTSARHEYAATLVELRTELFNLAGAGAVLLLTAVAACIIHVRAQAQSIFARHISGWTFVSIHRLLLAVEAVIALAFVGWSVRDTVTTLAARNDPSQYMPANGVPASGIEPFYATAIALATLLLTLVSLAFFHRRIVREGATQA